MSRNASGTYTLPTGNPVVSGTDITVTWGNTTMDDIAIELTDSLSRSGKGGMLAPLTFDGGTVTVPGISFVSDTNSGWYRIGADNLGMSVGGVKIGDYANGAVSFVATAVDALAGPIFSIFRDSASPADADLIGEIRFDGEDDGSNITTYAALSAQIDDVTDTTEDGTLLVKTMEAGTLTTQIDISSAAVAITPPVTFAGTLTVGTLTLGGGTITDSSGAISFGDANLVTTGTLGSGALTATSGNFSGAFTSLGIDDNATSTQLTISDTTSTFAGVVDFASDLDIGGDVTVGDQVIIGTSGVATTSGNDLIVGQTNANDYGITIKSGSANIGNIFFGDDDVTTVASRMGRIAYDHSDNSMFFNTNSQTALTIDSSRKATFAGVVNVDGVIQATALLNGGAVMEFGNGLVSTAGLGWASSSLEFGYGVVSRTGADQTYSSTYPTALGRSVIRAGNNQIKFKLSANQTVPVGDAITMTDSLVLDGSGATFASDVSLSDGNVTIKTGTSGTEAAYDAISMYSGNSSYPATIKSYQGSSSTRHGIQFWTSDADPEEVALTINPDRSSKFAGAVNFYGIRSNTAGANPYATHVGGAGTWKFRVATSGSSLNWDWQNVLVARMLNNGNWQNTNNSYGAISDINVKQDITDARSQWDDIKAIQLRNFRYIDEVQADENAKEHLGVIAQEVQEVSAGLVSQSDEEEHLGVNYMLLCVKAVGALQEAMTKIEDLNDRLKALENA